MASVSRIPVKSIATTIALTLAITLSRTNIKMSLQNFLTGPGSSSRIIALLFLLANMKNLPFVWHYRVLHTFFKHLVFSRHKFDPNAIGANELGPAMLFQPVITSSRSGLYECDYNLHKSNSTYFSDLDVTRSHIVCVLCREGIEALKNNSKTGIVRAPDGSIQKGDYFIMLGGTMSTFKREIKPYQKYEMWSRILCWDRKWLYIVTHFVKAGTTRPDGYTLGPPLKGMFASFFASKNGTKKSARATASKTEVPTLTLDNKNIHTSSISKYVTKVGRLTVHPEVFLEASGLLPPKPGGWAKMSGLSGVTTPSSGTDNVENGAPIVAAAANIISEKITTESAASLSATPGTSGEQWDWKRIQAENKRGLQIAEHFAALDGLHEEFTGENRPAIGVYSDLF